MGEKIAGIQWEFESKGRKAAAEMPEEELTPTGSHAIPSEQVPEAGPMLATAPVQPGLIDQVAQLACDLGLGPGYGAVTGESRGWPRVSRTRLEPVRRRR